MDARGRFRKEMKKIFRSWAKKEKKPTHHVRGQAVHVKKEK
jgi:hypothetical protein